MLLILKNGRVAGTSGNIAVPVYVEHETRRSGQGFCILGANACYRQDSPSHQLLRMVKDLSKLSYPILTVEGKTAPSFTAAGRGYSMSKIRHHSSKRAYKCEKIVTVLLNQSASNRTRHHMEYGVIVSQSHWPLRCLENWAHLSYKAEDNHKRTVPSRKDGTHVQPLDNSGLYDSGLSHLD